MQFVGIMFCYALFCYMFWFCLQKVEITDISGHEDKYDATDPSKQTIPNKKRHFIHQGNHVTVIEGENISSTFNGYPTATNQNINYNSLERGTRRKLPQVPNEAIYGTNGTLMSGNLNSDLYTHSLPRKAKAQASSSRYGDGYY